MAADELAAGSEALAALRENDEHAWRLLHDREFPYLYRFARGMGADPDLAEDCASEAFVRLVRDFTRLRFEGDRAIRSWLLVVCRNYFRDQVRKRHGGSVPIDAVGIRSADDRILTRAAIASALAALPEAQREVIVMRFILGMPSKDVAATSGRNIKAVESLQHRALDALRRSPSLRREEA